MQAVELTLSQTSGSLIEQLKKPYLNQNNLRVIIQHPEANEEVLLHILNHCKPDAAALSDIIATKELTSNVVALLRTHPAMNKELLVQLRLSELVFPQTSVPLIEQLKKPYLNQNNLRIIIQHLEVNEAVLLYILSNCELDVAMLSDIISTKELTPNVVAKLIRHPAMNRDLFIQMIQALAQLLSIFEIPHLKGIFMQLQTEALEQFKEYRFLLSEQKNEIKANTIVETLIDRIEQTYLHLDLDNKVVLNKLNQYPNLNEAQLIRLIKIINNSKLLFEIDKQELMGRCLLQKNSTPSVLEEMIHDSSLTKPIVSKMIRHSQMNVILFKKIMNKNIAYPMADSPQKLTQGHFISSNSILTVMLSYLLLIQRTVGEPEKINEIKDTLLTLFNQYRDMLVVEKDKVVYITECR
ncbi:MAG: hypothetical protein Q8R83_04680, partial [Legionellaceae bacterium]|nr:hypothetical protein [Legionellaceae bacterium]